MPEPDTLNLYLQFEYLTAGQLRDLLTHIERLHDALYSGMTRSDPSRMTLQSRLRISDVRTGDSLTLVVAEGVRMLAESGVITVPAALGVLGIAGKLIVSAAKGAVEARKSWHEGTKAKYEGKVAKREFEEGGKRPSAPIESSSIPDDAKLIAANSATQIVNLIEYSPNITALQVNGQVVVSKTEAHLERQ